jgi:glycosyltransferase involved in cell wall biosynthesis
MKLPKVSIIVPAYNEEQYIDACLAPLTHQETTVPYEIIVVDNNSKDKTGVKAKCYKNVRVITERRQGLAIARNAGAKAAKGSILVFVDADCVTSEQHVEILHSLFSKNPDVDGITGPYIYRDGSPIVRFATDKLHYFHAHFFLSRLLFGVQMLLGGNTAFRKKIFHELHGFNETITDINDPEDLDMAIRCHRQQKKILFTQKVAVESSFRRMKKTMMQDAPTRFINQYRRLLTFALTG